MAGLTDNRIAATGALLLANEVVRQGRNYMSTPAKRGRTDGDGDDVVMDSQMAGPSADPNFTMSSGGAGSNLQLSVPGGVPPVIPDVWLHLEDHDRIEDRDIVTEFSMRIPVSGAFDGTVHYIPWETVLVHNNQAIIVTGKQIGRAHV